MTYEWHDFVGNIGVLFIVAAYLLLQMQRMSAQGWLWSAVNGLGALLVLISLTQQFDLLAFAIALVWLFISIYGLKERYRRRRFPARE